MLVPGLVLFEGLPGSGKSTSASELAGWMAQGGALVDHWPESRPDHPVDLDQVAVLTDRDRERLGAAGPGWACVLIQNPFFAFVARLERPYDESDSFIVHPNVLRNLPRGHAVVIVSHPTGAISTVGVVRAPARPRAPQSTSTWSTSPRPSASTRRRHPHRRPPSGRRPPA